MREYNQNIDSVLLTPALILTASVASVYFVINIAMNPMLSFYAPFVFLAFLSGASMASFIAAMVERLPTGESPNTPSHCACGRNLKPWENVPLLGWLTLKVFHGGKTKCCDVELPAWYFLMEATSGFLFAGFASYIILHGFFQGSFIALVTISLLTIIFLVSDYRNITSNDYPETS
jgi:prepilin signal peptidase PulO-like enzyme (type II secretory pathway)